MRPPPREEGRIITDFIHSFIYIHIHIHFIVSEKVCNITIQTAEVQIQQEHDTCCSYNSNRMVFEAEASGGK